MWPAPIIVKQEFKNEIDSFSIEDPIYDDGLQSAFNAIVYTTKLDDMTTLQRDLRSHTKLEITQSLLSESKPTYYSPNNSKLYSKLDKSSYYKVVKFVEEINAKDEPYDHSVKNNHVELDKLNKPCYVVLHDLKYTCSDKGRYRQNIANIRKINSITASLESDDDDADNVPLVKMIKKNDFKFCPQNDTAVLALVCDNTIAFVYLINTRLSMQVTEHFVMYPYNEIKLKEKYPNEIINTRHYCCWYSREYIIKELVNILMFRKYRVLASIMKTLSESHKCRKGNCQCCCSVKYLSLYSDTKTQTTQKPGSDIKKPASSNSIIVDQMRNLDKHVPSVSELICKAILYNLNKTERKPMPIPEPKHKDITTVIRLENDGSKKHIEFYEIGHNDQIIRSLIVDNDKEASYIEMKYKKIAVSPIKKKCCCWYSRKNIISELRVIYSPNILKYIQTPHQCETNKCKCCCKPKKDLISLQRLIEERQWTYTHWPAIVNHTTAHNRNPVHFTIPSDKNKNVSQRKKKSIQEETTAYNRNPEHCTLTSHINKNVVSQRKKSTLEEDDKMVNKFKKLKMRVNSEGKLEAILDSPAKHLSVMELKILYHILALSSKQINKLHNVSPEQIVDQVNLKESSTSKSSQAVGAKTTRNQNTLQLPNQELLDSSSDKVEHIKKCKFLNDDIVAYQELRQIIKIKNILLANGTKSHYKTDDQPSVPLPVFRMFKEIPEIPIPTIPTTTIEVPKSSQNTLLTSTGSNANSMPKIIKVASYANSSTDTRKVTNVASKRNPNPKRKIRAQEQTQVKKIRVKSPSELINTAEAPVNTQTLLTPAIAWTTPREIVKANIISKAKRSNTVGLPLSNNVSSSSATLPAAINNTDKQEILAVTPNVVSTSTNQIPLVVLPNNTNGPGIMYPFISCSGYNNSVISENADAQTQNGRWLTVRPLQLNTNTGLTSILTQLLQAPRTQPNITPQGELRLPPLIPIVTSIPDNPIPSNVKKEETACTSSSAPSELSNQNKPSGMKVDVEQSIRWNLIVDKEGVS